jgi:sentrin-specific protease 8
MSSAESDPILVSYHDSIVRKSNLETLDNSNWLDDNIITFAFEYLQYESKFSKDNQNLFEFITPPVVQLIKMSDDLFAEQLLQSIDFLGKEFLILPINDNTRVTVFGGSHWSLLILSIRGKRKRENCFVFS